MSGDVVARAKAALATSPCTDAMQDFFQVGLVRELLAENEKLRGAIETIRDIATGPREAGFRLDILAVIERAGIEP